MLIRCSSGPAVKPATFATPEAAVAALAEALRAEDRAKLEALFGSDCRDLFDSGDDVADRNTWRKFVKMYDARHRLDRTVEDTAVVCVGEEDWPLPVPVVRDGDRWLFDGEEGKEEILNRRIGKNELAVIQVCLALVDAQREYVLTDWDGDGVLEYARKFRSEPGRKNGLYWKAEEGGPKSMLGPLFEAAVAEGYGKVAATGKREPYHGYFYRVLEKQGPDAPGGELEYVVREDMIGGFAFVAWPADYGSSGVVTFIVNHDGTVYQKDLGDDTAKLAESMQAFNPDGTWKKAQE
jgi:hypothetical protein